MPYKKLTPKQKLALIKSVLERGEAVSDACRRYDVSRKSFYQWLERYRKAEEGTKLYALSPIKAEQPPSINHPRKTTYDQEQAVLNLICENPNYSSRTISRLLPKVSRGRPWLSEYGVRKVLKRMNLSHIEDRKRYVEQFAPVPAPAPVPRFIPLPRWLVELPSLLARPPPILLGLIGVIGRIRKIGQIDWVFSPTSIILSTLSILFALGTGILTKLLLASQSTLKGKIGILFSEVSLISGFFFFLYSMKYYFTLAMVLAYSRQKGVDVSQKSKVKSQKLGAENGNHSLGSGLLSRVNGKGNNGYMAKLLNGWGRNKSNNNNLTIEQFNNYSSKNLPSVALAKEGGNGLSLNNGHLDDFDTEISNPTNQPFISIHLPLYNEKRVVERVIRACAQQDYDNFEVLVLDDSTDETTEIAEKVAGEINERVRKGISKLKTQNSNPHVKTQKLDMGNERWDRVRVLHRPTRQGFKGGALKYALENVHPKTEYIMVFDADFVPFPDTIKQFLRYFKLTTGKIGGHLSTPLRRASLAQGRSRSPLRSEGLEGSKIAAITGYQWHVLNKNENWITRGVRTEYSGSYIIERSGRELLNLLKIIHGSVYMIRRDVLEEDGIGWGTSITEDFELTLRLYSKGYKVVFTPYIQAPSECVSTLKRLIRQRMRWSEGHSHCVRRMFKKLMFGSWEPTLSRHSEGVPATEESPTGLRGSFDRLSLRSRLSQDDGVGGQDDGGEGDQKGTWKPSPLTFREKLEFLYLTPYYLQSALFMIGNLAWFLAEAVFHVRLPYWTELWGWSLVFTNMFSLPLINGVGLFIEEADSRDYLGLLSFIALCYLLVPFQAYASIKGFLEPEEGTWFRTPKTGHITIDVVKGTFSRLFGFFSPGRREEPVPALAKLGSLGSLGILRENQRFALASAGSRFNGFAIQTRRVSKRFKLIAPAFLTILLIFSISLTYFIPLIPSDNRYIDPHKMGTGKFGIGSPPSSDPGSGKSSSAEASEDRSDDPGSSSDSPRVMLTDNRAESAEHGAQSIEGKEEIKRSENTEGGNDPKLSVKNINPENTPEEFYLESQKSKVKSQKLGVGGPESDAGSSNLEAGNTQEDGLVEIVEGKEIKGEEESYIPYRLFKYPDRYEIETRSEDGIQKMVIGNDSLEIELYEKTDDGEQKTDTDGGGQKAEGFVLKAISTPIFEYRELEARDWKLDAGKDAGNSKLDNSSLERPASSLWSEYIPLIPGQISSQDYEDYTVIRSEFTVISSNPLSSTSASIELKIGFDGETGEYVNKISFELENNNNVNRLRWKTNLSNDAIANEFANTIKDEVADLSAMKDSIAGPSSTQATTGHSKPAITEDIYDLRDESTAKEIPEIGACYLGDPVTRQEFGDMVVDWMDFVDQNSEYRIQNSEVISETAEGLAIGGAVCQVDTSLTLSLGSEPLSACFVDHIGQGHEEGENSKHGEDNHEEQELGVAVHNLDFSRLAFGKQRRQEHQNVPEKNKYSCQKNIGKSYFHKSLAFLSNLIERVPEAIETRSPTNIIPGLTGLSSSGIKNPITEIRKVVLADQAANSDNRLNWAWLRRDFPKINLLNSIKSIINNLVPSVKAKESQISNLKVQNQISNVKTEDNVFVCYSDPPIRHSEGVLATEESPVNTGQSYIRRGSLAFAQDDGMKDIRVSQSAEDNSNTVFFYPQGKKGALEIDPTLSTTVAADTLNVSVSSEFEIEFDRTKGGIIDSWYDLENDSGKADQLSDATDGLFDFYGTDGTTRRISDSTSTTQQVLEVTDSRAVVQYVGNLGAANYDYTLTYTIQPTGEIYIKLEITNNTGSTVTWTNQKAEITIDSVTNHTADGDGVASDADAMTPGTNNWVKWVGDGTTEKDTAVLYHYSGFNYVEYYTSGTKVGFERDTNEAQANGATTTRVFKLQLRPDTDDLGTTETEPDKYSNEYLNPDNLSFTTGSEWNDNTASDFQTKAGSFALNTATGYQSIAGVGFQPKVVLFLPTNDTADGVSVHAHAGFGVGISLSDRRAITANDEDGQATTDAHSEHTDALSIVHNVPGVETADYEADFVSNDADGFTINVTTAPASAKRVGYLALGGSDLTNAASGHFLTGAPGDQSVTGVGFQPDAVIFFNMINTVAPPDAAVNFLYGLGFAVSSSERAWMFGTSKNNVATSDTGRWQGTDACVVLVSAVGAVFGKADFVSNDADGFTINWSDASADRYIHYIALKGGQYAVGNLTTQTSTGNFSETGVGFQPSAGLFASFLNAASGSEVAGLELSQGFATSSSDRFVAGAVSEDGLTLGDPVFTNSDSFQNDGLMYQNYDYAQAVEGAIDFVSWDSDGFTLNQTDADPSANQMLYLVMGADEYNEAQGAYTIDAATSTTYNQASRVQFDIDGGTYTQYKPKFKIRKWRSTDLPTAVTLEGETIYPGATPSKTGTYTGYNASFKPFSEAWYEDGGTSTKIADGGDTADADEYLNDPTNTYTLTGYTTTDTLYLGSDDQFNGVNYILSTQGVDASAAIDWEYYNGSAWTDLSGDSSETSGSDVLTTTSGSFYFTEPSDWATFKLTTTELGGSDVSERTLYWIRGTPGVGYDTVPIIDRMWTDILVFQYLGDLSSNSQTFVITSEPVRLSEGSIQIDVPNRYRAIMETGDTSDYILIKDRAQNDSSPNSTHEFQGPYIYEGAVAYQLSWDADRKTTILESNSLRARIRVEGCFDTAGGGACLNDGTDDILVTVDYTFTTEGVFVTNITDFRSTGVALDADAGHNGYEWLSVWADVTDGAFDDGATPDIIYGDGSTEVNNANQADGAEFEDSNKYVVLPGTTGYQDAFIGIQRAGWFDESGAGSVDEWQWDEANTGTQDLIAAQEQNITTTGIHYAKWFFLMLAQGDLDTEAEREAYINDYRNPDFLSLATGTAWNSDPASAFQTKVGNFALNTGTGNQSVTGIGFQPKVVIFLPTVLTADGVTADLNMGFGAAVSSSSRWALSANDEDAVNPTDATRSDSDITSLEILNPGSASTRLYASDFVSMDADGFTINITSAPASAYRVGYLAISGTDLTNAAAGNFTGSGVGGSQSVTGVGFQPDAIMLFNTSDSIALPDSRNDANLTAGWAVSPTQQGWVSFSSDDGISPSDSARQQRSDACIGTLSTAGVVDGEADLVSFDADGFTINWTTTDQGDIFFYVALKGGSYSAGSITSQTSTGNFATTGVGFQGSAGLFASFANAASASEIANAEISFGMASSPADRFVHGGVSEDNQPTSDTDEFADDGLIYQNYDFAQGVEGAIDFVSFDSDGFTLNQTDADPSGNEILYFVMGPTNHYNEAEGIYTVDASGSQVELDIDGIEIGEGSILFDDGSSEYLEVASTPVTTYPFTLATWFYSDDVSTNQALIQIQDASSSTNYHQLLANGAGGGDPVTVYSRSGTAIGSTTTGYSANTWHHACGVFAANNDRAAFIDGGSKGTDTTVSNDTGIDSISIGRAGDSSPGVYMSGRIAEAAIWSVALTDAECAQLADGASPDTIQAGNLKAYWPLPAVDDLEDQAGSYNLTAYNTPTTENQHPWKAPRHKPNFKIRKYRENSKPSSVTMEGAGLSEGTDYNVDYKPISDAYFADELTWYSTLEDSGSVTSPDVGTAGTVDTATFTTGKYGNGMQVNATTENPYFVSSNNISGTAGIVEFWYKYTDTAAASGYFFACNNGSGTNNMTLGKGGNTTDIDFIVNDGSAHTNSWDGISVAIHDGGWHHIRLTYDSATDVPDLYLDGILQTRDATSAWVAITPQTNTYLGNDDSGNAIGGIIDEFRVYSPLTGGADQLAQGGDTADSNEYLFSEARDYTLDLRQLDTNNRGEYLYLGSDSMFSGVNVDLDTVGAVGSATAGLFNINHEGGNLEEYDSLHDPDGNEINATTASGLAGTAYGMAVDMDDTDQVFGEVTLSDGAFDDYRIRFYIDPNSITMGTNQYFSVIKSTNTTLVQTVMEVNLGYDGSNYEIEAYTKNDGGSWIGTSFYDITDAEHYVEVHIVRASTVDANDGTLDLWIDGTWKEQIANIDIYNNLANVPWIRIGATDSVDNVYTGTVFFDEFKINDTGTAIGAWAAEAVNLDWEYWNGDSWADLEAISGFTDGTSHLTADGTVYWDENPTNWRPYSMNGSTDLYYIRASINKTAGSYTTDPIENFIKTDILLLQYLSNVTASDQTLVVVPEFLWPFLVIAPALPGLLRKRRKHKSRMGANKGE